MVLLGIDTSAKAASVAICDETQLLAEAMVNTKLTHSQTIMPMVQSMLENAHIALNQVDAFAVSAGPGSFTGLRIGIAAVKGMAMALNKPCVAVSTLEALAYNLRGFEGIICAVMDARCNQVYTASFRAHSGAVERLTEDSALPIEELIRQLTQFQEPVFFVGDGAGLCYNNKNVCLFDARLAPEHMVNQSAASVCRLALERMKAEPLAAVGAEAISPVYLRLPQAERELRQKQAAL
ncbi:tRNA (adenosine(37)-N6)-threonylcarbamoyltransferase complex dimerization subunit type 1 TsaB [Acetanaerobacterium elongatum]|uniref:tRNA threonylcarbamoyladenosine biosynthesis protein TsaB n=1 Tax=Acetanaerobacterium elongatum TaxID=258515 RepID=A0A1G9W796_9FIRM|nr:tRNA (adenosine(37)-N6)-threonylcarbamoyltransferase complex dimerization subunit type 1 TsaB [Acetanaerobacterium elongatum]SDM80127.1 tRNA threonylcarbamoyladenosine biosynthesis protein TsaB [Acetanaerobacterium elongatum]